MMSQMEERAKRLQSKVQQLYEGQFELRATKRGTAEELSQIVSGNTRYHELGIILFENSDGDVIFFSRSWPLSDTFLEHLKAKTLMIAAPARYLGIDGDCAGLKLFNLMGTNV